jgi:hypothetical protein
MAVMYSLSGINLKEHLFEDLGVDGRVALKLGLERLWTGLSWLRIKLGAELL